MFIHIQVILLLSLVFLVPIICLSDKCPAHTLQNTLVPNVLDECSSGRQLQYLLYDVQDGEGFNLRRDVYMRMATIVYYLNHRHNLNVTLVLPSWGPLAHWKRDKLNTKLPWSTFFHLQSLSTIIPVIELNDFLEQYNSQIDLVISLSYFDDSLDDELKGKPFIPHHLIDDKCSHSFDGEYYLNQQNKVSGCFWSYEELIIAHQLICCYFEGTTASMAKLLVNSFSSYESIVITDSQIILHDAYGSQLFWQIRKSMKFSSTLIDVAHKFIMLSFSPANVSSSMDEIIYPFNRYRYIGVHLRRSDFTQHRKDVPTLPCVAEQILTCITQNCHGHLEGITHVFLASDGNINEIQHLTLLLEQSDITVVTYKNDTMTDGEVAIIHQIICSQALFFIGTFGSTFTFRIQEEREILSFPPESTFNCFCATCINTESLCKQESQLRLIQ